MKIRTRLILAFLVLVGLGFCTLMDWIIEDLKPRYLATMEESMVDSATLLSSFLEKQLMGDTIAVDQLRAFFSHARGKRFVARIYEVTKERLDMRVYVTDRNGIVIFDSDDGKDEGKDYSRWLDVGLTLKGEYGARTTPQAPGDRSTSVLYVAAPIRSAAGVIGVLTVCKPADSATRFFARAKRQIILSGLLAAMGIVLLGMVIYYWITLPIEKLTQYANAVRDGRRATLPALGDSEIGQLGDAFEEMRDALEGREYVSEYVQTLTHEMKSPLSAIRGAAELLDENMPPAQRNKFLENIRTESRRIQDLVNRLLQLSALEKRKGLRETEPIDLGELIEDIRESMGPLLAPKSLSLRMDTESRPTINGERFLVRQAISNVLHNAIEFSPPGSTVAISLKESDGSIEIDILDEGPGVPDYALARVFDRFYSLRRPDTGKKSSGLGLTLVREVTHLHGGDVELENAAGGGVRAVLRFPLNPS